MEKINSVHRGSVRWNIVLQTLALVVVLSAVNYFAFNHYGRWDFSRSQKFTLAEQSRQTLRQLTKPLHITVFFSPTSVSPEQVVYQDVQNLMRELVFSGRPHVEFEMVDPVRDLTRARELQAKYKFSAAENVVILDYDGRVKFVPVMDMADFDMTPMQSGEPPRLTAFKGEQAMTSALISLLNPEKRSVYFLQGHGEPTIGTGSPLSVFEDYIDRQNINILPLSLGSTDAVPKNCSVLAIVSAQADLDERETAVIESYWKNGGRLLILLDPSAVTPRLHQFLSEKGIIARDDRVLRVMKLPVATLILRDVTAEFLATNAVTKRLVGTDILFPGATQSLALDEEASRKSQTQLRSLIQAKEEFWGESEYITDENKGVRYDDGKDAGFPLIIAASADRGGVSDDRIQIESSKLIVVGSCQFALDAAMRQPGLDFLSSAMNWLLDRSQFTGVVPKKVNNFSLHLPENQVSSLAMINLFAIPGAAALIGVVVWLRRRS